MKVTRRLWLYAVLPGLALAGLIAPLHAQNLQDDAWQPVVASPAYPPGKGPVVMVDEAHFNLHTIGGRYRSFARMLELDGYVVRPGKAFFSARTLRGTRILVIATALSARNRFVADWSPPIASAFTPEEIRAVAGWVRRGGSLLLIADHLPFAGAEEKLAAVFGFELIDGYAVDRREILRVTIDRPLVFARKDPATRDGALIDHAITRGRNPTERVESVMTFMGSAFRARVPVSPLLVFGKFISSYQTETFGKLSATTPSIPAAGLMQGAARRYGKGRVVLYSEAGMFGAQVRGGKPVGMNHSGAGGNVQLLLNTIHWLDGLLK